MAFRNCVLVSNNIVTARIRRIKDTERKFGIANTQWDLDASSVKDETGTESSGSESSSIGDRNPNWYSKWDGEDNSSSSSSSKSSVSLVVALSIASFLSLVFSVADL